jgi:hypothetical protein
MFLKSSSVRVKATISLDGRVFVVSKERLPLCTTRDGEAVLQVLQGLGVTCPAALLSAASRWGSVVLTVRDGPPRRAGETSQSLADLPQPYHADAATLEY